MEILLQDVEVIDEAKREKLILGNNFLSTIGEHSGHPYFITSILPIIFDYFRFCHIHWYHIFKNFRLKYF